MFTIILEKDSYEIEKIEDVDKLLKKFPEAREIIFDQILSFNKDGSDSIEYLTKPFLAKDTVKLFPEKEELYFEIVFQCIKEWPDRLIDKNLLLQPEKLFIIKTSMISGVFSLFVETCPNYLPQLIDRVLEEIEPNNKLLIAYKNTPAFPTWNQLATHCLSDLDIIKTNRELLLLIRLFPQHGARILNHLHKQSKTIGLVERIDDLELLVTQLPQLRNDFCNIYVTPDKFNQLVNGDASSTQTNFETLKKLFPQHKAIQTETVLEAANNLKTDEENKQKFKEVSKTILLFRHTQHPLFNNMEKGVVTQIASLASEYDMESIANLKANS